MRIPLVSLLVLALPLIVQAQETAVAHVLGLFNIFVGILLTVSLLMYFVGAMMWVTRLGTWPSYRTEAIKVLEWAVMTLFVLNVLLIIVQFFQKHAQAASYVLSAIIVLIVAWVIFKIAMGSGGEKEEGEGH